MTIFDKQIHTQRALITGSSRGIGFACAKELASKGFSVAMSGRSEDSLEALHSQLTGHNHIVLAGDLCNASVRDEIIRRTIDWGPLDIIVHCLGGYPDVIPADIEKQWDAFYRLNVVVPVAINNDLIPIMEKQASGKIIHLSSSAANHGRALIPYSAAKAALNRYIIDLGRRYASKGIAICGISPAAVSGINNYWVREKKVNYHKYQKAQKNQALGRFQTPKEIASFVGYLSGPQGILFAGSIVNLDALAG